MSAATHAQDESPAPIGRPTRFAPDLVDVILTRMSGGESLRTICRDETLPHIATVLRWVADPRHADFREQYARAREAQADALVEDLLEIADDGTNDWMEKRDKDGLCIGYIENGEAMRRSDLRIKTRQWLAARLKPRAYGDKLEVQGDPERPVVHKITREIVTRSTKDAP